MMMSLNPLTSTGATLPNTLSTQANVGTLFAQPTQASQFGVVPPTTPLTPQSSQSITPATMALNPQTLPTDASIFAGTTPTGVSPTGVTASQPFQFANPNTVGGLNLNTLAPLLQQSEAVGQQALANPPVMPRSAGELPPTTNIVLTPEVLEQLQQQPPEEEATGANAELQAKVKELEKKLTELKKEKPTSQTQTAFASSPSPDELQKQIKTLEQQIAELKPQKTTTAMQNQIYALEKQLEDLKAGATPTVKNPKEQDKAKPVITPVNV